MYVRGFDSLTVQILFSQITINRIGYISHYFGVIIVRFAGILYQDNNVAFLSVGKINHSGISLAYLYSVGSAVGMSCLMSELDIMR